MKKDYNMSQMVSSPDFSEEEIMERRRFKEQYGFRQEKSGRYRAIFWIRGKKYDLNRKNELDLIKAVEAIVNGELATIRTEWDQFIEWSKSKKKSDGTIEDYKIVYNNQLVHTKIIDIPLKKIKASDIENLFYELDKIKPIKKEYWNRGIGTEMLKRIIEQAKKMKIRVIELEVISDNARGINLYHKMGFTDIGTYKDYFYVNGMFKDAIVMQKIL